MNWSWLLPTINGIPVLMYHRVWPGITDALTVTPEHLYRQWNYLKAEGYYTLSLPEYLEIARGKGPYSGKAMLITFDDGYRNNLTYVYPLLKEFGWKATFFVVGNTLEGVQDPITDPAEEKMTLAELKSMDPDIVQMAMHGYAHESFKDISLSEAEKALSKMTHAFEQSGLKYHKVLAYPYGARPRKDAPAFKELMGRLGITAAFRIGNKVSEVPAKDLFEIKRIDIKGTDSIENLAIKLKKGKLKPF